MRPLVLLVLGAVLLVKFHRISLLSSVRCLSQRRVGSGILWHYWFWRANRVWSARL